MQAGAHVLYGIEENAMSNDTRAIVGALLAAFRALHLVATILYCGVLPYDGHKLLMHLGYGVGFGLWGLSMMRASKA
jgi:hypothetical protein